MPDAINWKDEYEQSHSRIVLTPEQLLIPGIRCFGKQDDSFARAPLPNHFHECALELTFITEGTYTFRIENADYRLNGGELFIAYPDEVHSTNQLPMSVGELYWLQLDITALTGFLYLSETASVSLLERFSRSGQHVMPFGKRDVRRLLARAFSAALEQSEDSRYLCASCLVTILNLLCAQTPSDSPVLTPDIEASLHYINANLCSCLPLEEIAAHTGLSLSQFKQKFRQQIGISPRAYVNQQKIELSKQMLADGMSKTDIAMELYFNTSSYFSSVFRKYTTCSPSEYLQAVSKKEADTS